MILDVHAHVFPRFGGTNEDLANEQRRVHGRWRRMRVSTPDERYIPEPDEDVGFKAGQYGRFHWTKHGQECWIRRFPPILAGMEWPPEHMIAFMDDVGVDKAVLQAGYMNIDYCRDYFAECLRKWPNRFIGTVRVNYDIEKEEAYREAELQKLVDAVRRLGMKGVFQGYPAEQNVQVDDEKFEPYWSELSRFKTPHFFLTGVQGYTEKKQEYLDSLHRIEIVLKSFPDVKGIITHLGGNIRPPSDSNFTDTPKELMPLLKLPNVYFEVGYVLAYDRRDIWHENSEYPYPLHTKLVKRIYDEIGADRLLWGSDMPNTYRTCTYQQCLDLVRYHLNFLSEDEKHLVLGGNTSKLFRI